MLKQAFGVTSLGVAMIISGSAFGASYVHADPTDVYVDMQSFGVPIAGGIEDLAREGGNVCHALRQGIDPIKVSLELAKIDHFTTTEGAYAVGIYSHDLCPDTWQEIVAAGHRGMVQL